MGSNRVFWFLILGLVLTGKSWAGVFNTSQYAEPDSYHLGVEPEILLARGSGIAGTLRLTYGLSDLFNFQAQIGNGSGAQKFRMGAGVVMDVFPATDSQLGLGIGAQALLINVGDHTRGEFTLVPYLHRRFVQKNATLEPFVAFPLGTRAELGGGSFISSVSIGTVVETSEHLAWVLELGVAINRTSSSFSGGLVYTP